MRHRLALISLALLLLTAIGAAPRYLEELRIGGGYTDPVDGGADFEADGDILTGGNLTADGTLTVGGAATITGATTLAGDLYVNGTDILTTGSSLYLNPSGAGRLHVGENTTQLENNAGRLWFVNTDGTNSHFRFFMPDSAATSQDYGSIWCVVTDNTDGSEDALFRFALMRNGTYDYDAFSVNSLGDGHFDGDLSANGGVLTAGVDGVSRGVIAATRGTGGAEPASLKLQSRNGSTWYLFVEDDGTVRVHNALPANNSDGLIVGLQN